MTPKDDLDRLQGLLEALDKAYCNDAGEDYIQSLLLAINELKSNQN